MYVVPPSVLPVVSEESESEVMCSSGSSTTLRQDAKHVLVCVMSEKASSCKSGVHGIVELRLSTTAAVSGPTVAVPFIQDTSSQYNDISCAVLQ